MVFCLPLTSKAQNISQEQLTGTWVFNYDASFAKIEAKVKARYDSMLELNKARIVSAYKGRKISFNTDGSYLQTLSDGRKATGTWILNTDTKTIEITDPKGRVHSQKIKNCIKPEDR